MSAASSSLSLLFPKAIGVMLDLAVLPSSEITFMGTNLASLSPQHVALGLMGVVLAQACVNTVRSQLLTTAGENIAASIKRRALDNLLQQEMAFFDKEDSAELSNRLSADTSMIQKALTGSMISAARNVTMAAGATTMMVLTSPTLAAVSLASFPPVFAYASWQGRQMRAEQKKVQESLAQATVVAQRALGGLRSLRTVGADRALQPAYDAAVAEGARRAVVVGVRQGYFDASVQLAGNAAMLAVVAFGADQVGSGGGPNPTSRSVADVSFDDDVFPWKDSAHRLHRSFFPSFPMV